jgi:DNA uptake protein ComE-like DNA-binding protein
MWILPWFFSSPVSDISIEELALITSAADSMKLKQPETGRNIQPNEQKDWPSYTGRKTGEYTREPYSPKSLFPFDPNTASMAQWKELGVPDKTIGTLQKYLSKGGRIRKAEDLQKIYGFPPEAYEVLKPYIRLRENSSELPEPINKNFSRKKIVYSPSGYKPKDIPRVLINQSDSASWEALPGIGPRLASRIISFRAKLGGFSSVAQVGETFGLPDSTFQKIKPYLDIDRSYLITKLDINHSTIEELQAHPYISFQIAKVIIAYRDQHGPFKSKEDLIRIALMTPELYVKLEPYLVVY